MNWYYLRTSFRDFLVMGMVAAVAISLTAGLVISTTLLFEGVEGISHVKLANLEVWLVFIIAFGITTEAFVNGLHSAGEEWARLWRRLILYLTFGLALRGTAVYIAGAIVGIHEKFMVAAGLTATDPAATGVSLALTGTHGVRTFLTPYNWLATIESQLNDGEGLILFEIARHASISHLALIILHTALFALLIAAADTGARWGVRNLDYSGRLSFIRQHEPYVEILLVAFVYVGGLYLGYRGGISPILTAAIAAVIANGMMHRLPRERDYEAHEHVRRQLNDLWSQIGLGLVIVIAVAVMPYRAFISEPILFVKATVILVAIALSRLVFEFIGIFYGQSFHWGSAFVGLVSVGTASCLLGVPTVVGIALAAHGHKEDARIVFATIFLSWFTVYPTVKLMQWVDRRLAPLLRSGETIL